MKRIFATVAVFSVLLAPFILVTNTSYASNQNNGVDINRGNSNIDSICGQPGAANSSYCQDANNHTNRIYGKNGVIVIASYIIAIIAGVTAVIIIIIGAIRFMVSGGDPNAVAGARNSIIFALVGLLVIAAAESILLFVVNNI
jgi:hypothetical protein